MIRSMTGFGSASIDSGNLKASAVLRSVNHRFLDVSLHVGRRLAALEPEIKDLVARRVTRGRVDVTLQAATVADAGGSVVAAGPLVESLVATLRQLRAQHGLAGDVSVSDVARFNGALETVETATETDSESRTGLLALVAHALDGLDGMRAAEGARLAQVLGQLLDTIAALVEHAAGLAATGAAARCLVVAARVGELVAGLGLDEAKLYQEVVRFVERSDVTEEVERLRSHVRQARELIAAGGACGKRLDFLAQELSREANTVSSKAVSVELVQTAVALKTEIERLREQVQNVE